MVSDRAVAWGLVGAAVLVLAVDPLRGHGFTWRPGALLLLLVAGVFAIRRLSRRTGPDARRSVRPRRRPGWARSGQVLAMLMLCAVGAELLAAYGENTGDPAGVAFALVIFAALYGAPALLVRELAKLVSYRGAASRPTVYTLSEAQRSAVRHPRSAVWMAMVMGAVPKLSLGVVPPM